MALFVLLDQRYGLEAYGAAAGSIRRVKSLSELCE